MHEVHEHVLTVDGDQIHCRVLAGAGAFEVPPGQQLAADPQGVCQHLEQQRPVSGGADAEPPELDDYRSSYLFICTGRTSENQKLPRDTYQKA